MNSFEIAPPSPGAAGQSSGHNGNGNDDNVETGRRQPSYHRPLHTQQQQGIIGSGISRISSPGLTTRRPSFRVVDQQRDGLLRATETTLPTTKHQGSDNSATMTGRDANMMDRSWHSKHHKGRQQQERRERRRLKWSSVKRSDSDDDDEFQNGDDAFDDNFGENGAAAGSTNKRGLFGFAAAAAASSTSSRSPLEIDTDTPIMQWRRIRQQVGVFVSLARPYFVESIQSRWLLMSLVAITLLDSATTIVFSYVLKDFWDALGAKEAAHFAAAVGRFVVVLCVASPVTTLKTYIVEQFAVHWCEWMTHRTFFLYGTHQIYYKLEQVQQQPSAKQTLPTAASDPTDTTGSTITGTAMGSANAASAPTATTSTTKIDNPDQRITEDVHLFTSLAIKLSIKLMGSTIDLISFSIILWGIYRSLFGAAVLYAVIGTVVTAVLGKKLIRLQFQQSRRDADLRYALVRLRDNAESIAFYRGCDNVQSSSSSNENPTGKSGGGNGGKEGRAVSERIGRSMANRRYINVATRNLSFFTTSYYYGIEVIPIIVVAPRYFAGEIEMGTITQGVGAFSNVLGNLSIIIDSFEALSQLSAGIERLASFYTAMRAVNPATRHTSFSSTGNTRSSPLDITDWAAPTATTQRGVLDADKSLLGTIGSFPPLPSLDNSNGAVDEAANAIDPSMLGEIELQQWNDANVSPVLTIENLVLATPDRKRILISNLTLALERSQHLLIVGSSGTGKSSLLRAIAGLWTAGSGVIGRPADDYVYFLPQRPYCTMGSLKDQLLYPCTDETDEGFLDGSSRRNGYADQTFHDSHDMKHGCTDAELLRILEQIDLLEVAARAGDGNAARGLAAVMDWSNVLSLGEQQRLAFGRLLVNRPSLIILDEATSALDLANEARMYGVLQQMAQERGNLTYVSVGHRPSLLSFHSRKLRLDGGSDHELVTIDQSSAQALPSISL